MSKLNLTPEEEQALLETLERYLPDLEDELAHTEKKDFHKFLKEREAFMQDLIKRLKS
ncbi:MAG: hypothetical protein HGA29_07080 [Syntrophaceae bacterium]|nr:hypothetical protein [Syntrophaceae bacterium]